MNKLKRIYVMFKAIEGIYRNGKIELIEEPDNISNETLVIVTFLESKGIDLISRGIDEAHAAELRARLGAFAEDWDSPEMDIYDDYEANREKKGAVVRGQGAGGGI